MIYFTRFDVDDCWHWRTDCPSFPKREGAMAIYVLHRNPPWRPLCPECLRLERAAGDVPPAPEGSDANTV